MVLLPFLCIFFLLNIQSNVGVEIELPTTPNESKLQTYIVHVEQPKIRLFGESNDIESWYKSFLPATIETSVEQPRLLYSYQNVMSGFAARVTTEQVKAMEEKDGFISAMPESILSLHTTHTPDYLGLNQQFGLWKDSNFGEGVIIGVLDTGIHPSHLSFRDEGMLPPPAKWKGRCEFNTSVCNNKLIGARTFNRATSLLMGESPVDENGHGTHTASTAGGAFVKGAQALGNARGTAAGIAPLAHLAIYKVCSSKGCLTSDVLAGLDAAISDGVDVLSLSLGSRSGSAPFFKDNIAIGTFAAIQKGVFVSCAAGNSGPFNSTLSNDAPWILTVGASTINRRIVAVAKLGNGEEYDGESLFQPSDFSSTFLPLVYAGSSGNLTSAFCGEDSLTNIDVKGKIVVCEGRGGVGRIAKGKVVKKAGGAAMILINQQQDGFSTLSEAHVLPAAHVSYKAGLLIKAYVSSSKNPIASISFKGAIIGFESDDDTSAPAVASFSSRGPSLSSPGILKPDITGPGVNILAAWPFSLDNNNDTRSTFNVISGTSMSCPHLSGIAALIKSVHPNWSSAAVKSSIMTTANITTPEGKPILDQDLNSANFFAIGAGHVNPSKAADPGLVYDIQPEDYIPYLCGLYKDAEVAIIVQKQVNCTLVPRIREGDLNYPSFSLALGPLQTFKRTVTNVGDSNSIYSAVIEAPLGVSVTITPRKLFFSRVNQKITYSVTFRRISSVKIPGEFGQGYLKWVSRKNVVRSPISVKFN